MPKYINIILICMVIYYKNGFAAYEAGACTLMRGSQQCIDATPCKTDSNGWQVCLSGVPLPEGALSITQTCWEYGYSYACETDSDNTCTEYQSNPKCTVISSTCTNTAASTNNCIEWRYTYQCETTEAVTTTVATCDNTLGIAEMPAPDNSNNNFVKMAMSMEMASQGTSYIDEGILFSGVRERCSKGDYGLHNCCKSSPGAKSNAEVSNVLTSIGLSSVMYLGEVAIDYGSSYLYDAMYTNGLWTDGMTESFGSGGTNLASNGFQVGAYGFTYSTTNIAGQGLMSANTQVAAVEGGSGGYIYFNPYTFALMVVITYIQSLQECTSDEQMLAMHKGANLSERLYPDDCDSRDFLGECITYVEKYCSFNSVLAKIINIQGKTQLGKDISDCVGLTPDELSQIDFTRIDFSDFAPIITNEAQNNYPSSAGMKENYEPPMSITTQGSQQDSTNSVVPAYPQ